MKLINYLYTDNYDCIVVYKNYQERVENRSINWVIKEICSDYLIDLNGYIKVCRKKLNLGYHIPIYINDNLVLFSLFNRNKTDNLYINYMEIKGIIKTEDDNSIIIFKNNKRINLNVSYEKTLRIFEKCKIIVKYKQQKAIS